MRPRLALVVMLVTAALGSPALCEPDSAEITYWESVRDSTTPAELEAYLKAYPDGAFAPLARIRLKALEKAEQRPATPAPLKDAAGAPEAKAEEKLAETVAPGDEQAFERLELLVKPTSSTIFGAPRTVLGVILTNHVGWRHSCTGVAKEKEGTSVFLEKVIAGTPAMDAGLRPGDVIEAIDGKTLKSSEEVAKLVAGAPAGVSLKLDVLRPQHSSDRRKALEERANGNDAGAMLCLAFLNRNGLGGEKDEANAASWHRKAAEAGDREAMMTLARILDRGDGIGKDVAEANRWYRKAAEAGNEAAMTALGINLQLGDGIAKDVAEANRWYRKAAEAGNATGMHNLAFNMQQGDGITKDIAEANRWYRKAAEAGYTSSMFNLARHLANGNGITKDVAEANRWYRKAAEAGHAGAMNDLGINIENGDGIAKDVAEAHRWYRKSAEAGDETGMHNLARHFHDGVGTAEDPRQAAQWFFNAIKAGSSHTVNRLRDHGSAFSSECRRDLQQLLREAGHYDGEIDGDLGPGTLQAIEALYESGKNATETATAAQPSAPAAAPPPDLGNVKDLDTLE